jgi:FkbM family methyltransferase
VIGGRRLRIPILAGIGARNLQSHEPEVAAMLAVLLNRCTGTFIDVGVNIGQTLLKVVTKDPARTYIGFEPSLLCCYYVERLIQENNLEQCTILPIALGSETQAVELHFSRGADASATIVRHFWSGQHTKTMRRTVWAEKGDNVVEFLGLSSLGIVKVDVEGAELDVLTGLRETLERQEPFILVEVLPYTPIPVARGSLIAADIRKQRMELLVNLLKEIDYLPYQYRPDGVITQIVDFDAPQYDARMCNYLLAPRRRQSEIAMIEVEFASLLHFAA